MLELDRIPLHDENKQFLVQDVPWTKFDQGAVQQVISTVVYAAVDQLGLARMQIPAELVAAAIVEFVHPVNWMAASAAMQVSEAASVEKGEYAPCAPSKIFALCLKVQESLDEIESAVERAIKKGRKQDETQQA